MRYYYDYFCCYYYCFSSYSSFGPRASAQSTAVTLVAAVARRCAHFGESVISPRVVAKLAKRTRRIVTLQLGPYLQHVQGRAGLAHAALASEEVVDALLLTLQTNDEVRVC